MCATVLFKARTKSLGGTHRATSFIGDTLHDVCHRSIQLRHAPKTRSWAAHIMFSIHALKARTKALGDTHRVLYTLTVQGTKGGTHREPCSLYADCCVFKAHFQGLGAHGDFTITSRGWRACVSVCLWSMCVKSPVIPLLLEEPPRASGRLCRCTHERPRCILRGRGHHDQHSSPLFWASLRAFSW